MAIVASRAPDAALPTNAARLPRLLAYAQALGLERWLGRPKRGVPLLSLVLVWLVLAWRRSGRPYHVRFLEEPLLAAILGRGRLPCAQTLQRGLGYLAAKGLRAAVERAYLAALPARPGRVWAAVDAHQLPYWGRGRRERFQKGWSGSHSRRLRGYRLYLAVDTRTGQVITYALTRGRTRDHRMLPLLARRCRQLLGRRLAGVVADCGCTSRASVAALAASGVPFILGFARSAPVRARLEALGPQHRGWLNKGGAVGLGACPWDARLRLFALGARAPADRRGPWAYVTSLRSAGPQRLAATYRQRWRVEQAIEELLNGNDLDHLVGAALHPNHVAVGLRLLARNLALGLQLADRAAAPAGAAPLREPRAFRAAHVDGLGAFTAAARTIALTYPGAQPGRAWHLPWTHVTIREAA